MNYEVFVKETYRFLKMTANKSMHFMDEKMNLSNAQAN